MNDESTNGCQHADGVWHRNEDEYEYEYEVRI